MRLCIRLKENEAEQLKKMAASEITGTENTSEFIRLLLAREWNRRKGQGKPGAAQFQTAFRTGRPVQKPQTAVEKKNGFDSLTPDH
jgi:hypothetical protein